MSRGLIEDSSLTYGQSALNLANITSDSIILHSL